MTEELEDRGNYKDIKDERGHFKPGYSGNPAGRPKGAVSVTEAIRRKLQELAPGQDKRTYLDELVERIIVGAINEGNTKLMEQIWNYMDGKPKGSLDIGFDTGREDRASIRDTLNKILNDEHIDGTKPR